MIFASAYKFGDIDGETNEITHRLKNEKHNDDSYFDEPDDGCISTFDVEKK